MKKLYPLIFPFLLTVILLSCREEDELKSNQSPDTTFSIEEINLSGENRLNSIVRLSWYGKDPDGYVVGYELSLNGQNWKYTNSQDSTFRFSFSSGTDTTDIELYVRAIDNEGMKDPSPDYLKVPIKNTPPQANFKEDFILPDTTLLALTAEWEATDLDGQETIQEILISLNGTDWTNINRTKNIISLVPVDPSATDTTQARIYYESEENPASVTLEGLVLNDTNRLFIKAIDQAGTESAIDTSTTFYMKGKVNDVLVVGAVPTANSEYANILSNANIDYDFLDYAANNGDAQPNLWNITFRLQLDFYDKLFFYSDETIYTNPYTGLNALIIEFAAASLQSYVNNGGKYLISTSFDHNTPIDAFSGVLPIQSVSTKNFGSARLYQDSLAVSKLGSLPDLKPSSFAIIGVSVFNIDSLDTEVLYEAELSDVRQNVEWPDTKIVASGRRINGKLNQVFFSVQLRRLNGNNNLVSLFDQIFNLEFN